MFTLLIYLPSASKDCVLHFLSVSIEGLGSDTLSVCKLHHCRTGEVP